MIKELKDLSLSLRKQRSPLAAVMVFHVAEVTKIGRDKQRETTDDEAIQYVNKAIQKMRDNPAADQDEIVLLETLLPTMATEDEVVAFLTTLDDKSNKGVVMKAVKERFGVLVDMKMVSSLL